MAGKTRTIKPKKKGQHAIHFKEGGEHAALGVPQGQKIPASKHAAAARGDYGPKARREESFARNVLGVMGGKSRS